MDNDFLAAVRLRWCGRTFVTPSGRIIVAKIIAGPIAGTDYVVFRRLGHAERCTISVSAFLSALNDGAWTETR